MSPLRHHEETLAAAAARRAHALHRRQPRGGAHPGRVRAGACAAPGGRERACATRCADNPELVALEGEIDAPRRWLAGLRERQTTCAARVEATAKNGQELAGLQPTFDGSRRSTARARRTARRAAGRGPGAGPGRSALRSGRGRGAAGACGGAQPAAARRWARCCSRWRSGSGSASRSTPATSIVATREQLRDARR